MNLPPDALVYEAVTAGYGGRAVIEDLSFRLPAGGMLALLGPNGAGKSTLLRVATGLHAPWRGTVRLFGEDVRRLSAGQRARLAAVVPQDLSTPMAYTVAEMVLMGRTATLSRWGTPARRDRAASEQAMAYTDTLDLANRPFPELSGGERQRVALALALAAEPRLLLLDEPTSHLDMNHRLELVQLIRRINSEHGTTVVMVGHDLNLAAEFFPRLLLLDQGRVAADGRPEEVLQAETLRAVYHCEVAITRDAAAGCLRLFPRAAWPVAAGAAGRRVHLICGGGSGEELMRRLCLAGYTVTCGAVNERDSDATCAAALGVATALERPFSPIGAEALAAAARLASAAGIVILCDVPFGPGNTANLGLAEQALRDGRRLLLNTAHLAQRDHTPTREALPRLQALLAAGAETWEAAADALARLGAAAATDR